MPEDNEAKSDFPMTANGRRSWTIVKKSSADEFGAFRKFLNPFLRGKVSVGDLLRNFVRPLFEFFLVMLRLKKFRVNVFLYFSLSRGISLVLKFQYPDSGGDMLLHNL